MKLSIWQQFSSNHSASFTIVAEFLSEQEAFNHYMLIRRAVRNMVQDFERNAPEARYVYGKDEPPHEIAIRTWEQFGITPQVASDWLHRLDDKFLSTALKQIDNYILLRNLGDTWTAAEPLDRVLEKVSINLYRFGEQYEESFNCIIECHAPDEATAVRISQALKQSKEWRIEHKQPIPWLPYFAGYKHPKANELLQLEQRMLEFEQAIQTWRETSRKLRDNWKLESNPIKRRQLMEASSEYHQLERPKRPTLELDGLSLSMIYQNIDYKGEIRREGETLTLKTGYGFNGLPNALVPIVAWMRDMTCNVNISFEHIRD